jgi:dTDP-4-dehydrorhamnose reductase
VRVLITGAGGQLGRDLQIAFAGAGARRHEGDAGAPAEVVPADHARMDVSDRDAVLSTLIDVAPDVVVHAGAWTAVDACESDPDRAHAVNAIGTRHVMEGARLCGAHVIYISTDYVFDGHLERPYHEWDATNPLSVYGRSKLGGEMEMDRAHAIVRTSWVFGRYGANMVHTALRLARETEGPLRFVDDQRGCPTCTADLAEAVRLLAVSRLPGRFHVTNEGTTTWFDFVRAVLRAGGLDESRVEPVSTAELTPPRPAPRPANSVLDNAAWRLSGLPLLPHWADSLERLVKELPA